MTPSPTILIADDESHAVSVMSIKLREAGFNVLSASDGQAALNRAIEEKPDLLIAGYHMPSLSGLEICHRLHQAGVSLPTIMLTARGYSLPAHDMQQCRIFRLVNKPFSPRQLLSAVQEVLREAA